VHGVPIRVNKERLAHIFSRHPEMQGYDELIVQSLGEPDFVQEGDFGEKLGIRRISDEQPSKYIVAVYKEVEPVDGFLLTAYFTRRPTEWRKILWKR
jgi:hypothetical protein